nr:monocopper oxidase-like protein SKU5 [Ipomoea batatas]
MVSTGPLSMLPLLLCISLLLGFCSAEDPFVFYDFEVSYITASPLGVEQQVIAINGKFPGPTMNVTTNNNVVVNVHNKLDEDLLMHWSGIQMRKNSWQDGVLGTNCPIPSKWNWTYQFQVKDQIGSFFYFPSLHFQRAAGGFGGITVNNREIIPIPFDTPDGDITIMIGDWYTRNHTALRKTLDDGKSLGMPDGVLVNGKGPYRYNNSLVPDGIDYETITVHPGKTYRIRVSNVGISTSLNFRIQSHNLLLAETEGSYTVQQNYTSLDIHVGQTYSFLLTTDQNASSDYYIVASARWNVTASGARPNPQGSFRYGSINVTELYVIQNKPPMKIDGKQRTTINGISFANPKTPIRLADWFKVKGVYKLDFPTKPLTGPPKIETSVINGSFRGFMEIILQNNDTKVHTYHLSGYAFFVVGMDYGEWTENSRGTYNKWDGIARTTAQSSQCCLLLIMSSMQFVLSPHRIVVNPEVTNKTELPIPDNALYCGALQKMQKPQKISSGTLGNAPKLIVAVVMVAISALISLF